MSYFAMAVFVIVSIGLAATAYQQSGQVSWATDKCGCIGVFGLGVASLVMLCALLAQIHLIDAAAGMVLAFAVWMACRALRKQHDKGGVFGKTDKSPLGDK